MTNNVTLWLTASPDREDGVVDVRNSTGESIITDSLYTELWRDVWPLLFVLGLVGNTLVLVVLRREGLVRTSANVYLSAMAVSDSLLLLASSLVNYLPDVWDIDLPSTNIWTCRTTAPALATLYNGSIWILAAFTVERYVAVRFPLLKRLVCTLRNAGVSCVSLLVLAFMKNTDMFFILTIVDRSGRAKCRISQHYYGYVRDYRFWICITANAIVVCVILVCNSSIIRGLQKLLQSTAPSRLMHITFKCTVVSSPFVFCFVPEQAYYFIDYYWSIPVSARRVLLPTVMLMRYASHSVNFFLYSLSGAHFRSELVAMLCRRG